LDGDDWLLVWLRRRLGDGFGGQDFGCSQMRADDLFDQLWLRNLNRRSTEITRSGECGTLFSGYALIPLRRRLAFDSGQRYERCMAALICQACRYRGGHHLGQAK
jgi:hypothetical protein